MFDVHTLLQHATYFGAVGPTILASPWTQGNLGVRVTDRLCLELFCMCPLASNLSIIQGYDVALVCGLLADPALIDSMIWLSHVV